VKRRFQADTQIVFNLDSILERKERQEWHRERCRIGAYSGSRGVVLFCE